VIHGAFADEILYTLDVRLQFNRVPATARTPEDDVMLS
jgi:hypothetical protein